MIFSTEDYIKQKYIYKLKISSISKKNNNFKEYKKNKHLIVRKDVKIYAKNVSDKFIDRICNDQNNRIIFYGINKDVTFTELVGVCIYRKILNSKKKNRYVILLIGIHPKVRNCGYGSVFMNEIMIFFKKKDKETEIILHSLKEAITFYLNFGFEIIEKEKFNKFIINYEGIDINEDNLYFFKIIF